MMTFIPPPWDSRDRAGRGRGASGLPPSPSLFLPRLAISGSQAWLFQHALPDCQMRFFRQRLPPFERAVSHAPTRQGHSLFPFGSWTVPRIICPGCHHLKGKRPRHSSPLDRALRAEDAQLGQDDSMDSHGLASSGKVCTNLKERGPRSLLFAASSPVIRSVIVKFAGTRARPRWEILKLRPTIMIARRPARR